MEGKGKKKKDTSGWSHSRWGQRGTEKGRILGGKNQNTHKRKKRREKKARCADDKKKEAIRCPNNNRESEAAPSGKDI